MVDAKYIQNSFPAIVLDYPEEWLPENTAHLLFLCGEAITQKVLNSKAVNGRIPELASLVTSLCLVS